MAKSKGYLIDTHIFIWWMDGGDRLATEAKNVLQDAQQEVFISVASIWEMVIKKQQGKLKAPTDIEKDIKLAGFMVFPIELSHVLKVTDLPLYHKDPFDRLLIAQATVENLAFVTDDIKIKKYDLKVV